MYFIFVNREYIVWYSKYQNTVEYSFGSGFIAMKQSVDLVEDLRYTLMIVGVPMERPTSLLCDKSDLVINTTTLESTINPNHRSISYHRYREAQAAGIL